MKNKTTTLYVSEYTKTPIGRNSLDGPKNGSDFRDNHLIPALEKFDHVTIDFNGVMGTTPSFLEEVFGGIIRGKIITADKLKERVDVIYKYESVKKNIQNYIDQASAHIK